MAAITFDSSTINGLVSVVIPAYRSEQYIGETLESVSQQTYKSWEVIVVEDGHCGPTQEIVADFARRHPAHRVEYSHTDQNRGPSPTRNAAFAKARGEFVALLDADDRWFPDHLAGSIQSLQASGKDVVYSSVVMIEDHSGLLLGVWGPDARELTDFPQSLLRRNFINPSATVLRRQVLADVGPWDVTLRRCEDFCYWLRCIAAGKQFQYVGGCHCLYRKNHAGALTQQRCATQEQFAAVVERFIGLPGVSEAVGRRLAARANFQAARYHRRGNPLHDSSADPSRAASFMMRAWRLHPQRIDYLLQGILRSVADLVRRRRRPERVAEQPSASAAAYSRSSQARLQSSR